MALLSGCQKQDTHPPFIACDSDCGQLPGIAIGTGSPGGGVTTPTSDAGPGTLTGQVLLLSDQTFTTGALYTSGATITADGADGSPVSTVWDGADDYSLPGVARESTNWVGVKPTLVGGDPLLTYRAVDTTTDLDSVTLAMVSSTIYDGILNSVSLLRSESEGQVVLTFLSQGTHVPLAGLHVAMQQAEQALYRSGTTWVVDDGTSVTDQSGLVVFLNVAPGNAGGTQTVTVTKAAAGTTPAVNAGTFAVKVVEDAATLAAVDVQL